jgi:hypothetical protein
MSGSIARAKSFMVERRGLAPSASRNRQSQIGRFTSIIVLILLVFSASHYASSTADFFQKNKNICSHKMLYYEHQETLINHFSNPFQTGFVEHSLDYNSFSAILLAWFPYISHKGHSFISGSSPVSAQLIF